MRTLASIALLIFIVAQSATTYGNEYICSRSNFVERLEFSLEIKTAFHGSTSFKVCSKGDLKLVRVRAERSTHDEKTGIKETTIYEEPVFISEGQFSELISLLDKALASNLEDNVSGKDGSTWCVNSGASRTVHLVACFRSPGVKPDQRRVMGVYNLGVYLWKLTGRDSHPEFRLH